MARISQHPLPHGEYHGVVIVGAGIAGLTAAHSLLAHGIPALVLEEADHVGGRCETLQFEGGVFDVGAQSFTMRRSAFRPLVASWEQYGAVTEWTRSFPDTAGVSELASHPRFRGVTGMSDVAAALAAKVLVRLTTRVKRIIEGRGCWLVEIEGAPRIKADVVVLTPPLPVSLRLISDENTWRMGALLLPLTGVAYAPQLVVAAVLDGPSGLPVPGAIRCEGPGLAWLIDNHQKGISPDRVALTLLGTRALSERCFGLDEEEAVQQMLAEAAPLVNSRVVTWHTRVWPYGTPSNTLLSSYYLVEGRAPLYFSGDAFCGGQIEGAALSGAAVSRAIGEHVKWSKMDPTGAGHR